MGTIIKNKMVKGKGKIKPKLQEPRYWDHSTESLREQSEITLAS